MKRAGIAFSLVLIAGLAYLFGWSSIFSVKKVTINLTDTKVAQEVEGVLAQPPATVFIGEKMARVDKRVISSRLKRLAWVDGVSVSRNFFTGNVTISLASRVPIAQFAENSGTTKFLSENREVFSLSKDSIQSATSTNSFDWKNLPILNAPNPTPEILNEVAAFIREMANEGVALNRIDAAAPGEISSTLTISQQKVEVRWGSVQDLKLKKRVLDALLAAPENKKVKKIDLSDPQNPTVK